MPGAGAVQQTGAGDGAAMTTGVVGSPQRAPRPLSVIVAEQGRARPGGASFASDDLSGRRTVRLAMPIGRAPAGARSEYTSALSRGLRLTRYGVRLTCPITGGHLVAIADDGDRIGSSRPAPCRSNARSPACDP